MLNWHRQRHFYDWDTLLESNLILILLVFVYIQLYK